MTLPSRELEPEAPPEFEVRWPGPLDIPASLELFRRSGDDLLDRWDGATLVRTHPLAGGAVGYACRVTGSIDAPVLQVQVEQPAHAALIEQVVRSSFVPAPPEFVALLERDPVLARLNAAYPGLRPVRQFDLLSALVRCISAQQVNLRWAVITRRRLAEAFGAQHQVGAHIVYSLSAQRLAGASVGEIRALQFTTRKAEYLIAVAEAIAAGRLDLPTLTALPDEDVIARLTALRGIGRWTAEWILARGLGRACVVAGDLAVRKAIGLAYLDTALPPEAEVRQAVAHWGLSAGIAQALLLHGFAQPLG